jgi:hypothetical protein
LTIVNLLISGAIGGRMERSAASLHESPEK